MNDFIKGDTLLIKDLTDEINRLRQDHSKLLDELNTAVMKLANKEQERLDTLNDNKYYKNLCLELTQQLAEKEKEHELLIDNFEEEAENLRKQIKQESDARKRFVESNKQLKQSQNQTAIAELEKVRNNVGDYFKVRNLKWTDKLLVGKVCNLINEILDQQIKSLKGETNEQKA